MSLFYGKPYHLHVCRRLSTQAKASTKALDVQAAAQTRIRNMDDRGSFSKPLVDSFRRKHNYLRISLTERCNLRCFYCMPSEGIELSPDGKLLTNSEIFRLATLFVKNGITKIRLTGGEPTVRKGISEIITELNGLRSLGLQSIGMTTNGVSLHRRLPEMVENGLTHLNLSLDTLDTHKFEIMTRRRGLEAVLKTLDVALKTSLESIKLNVVVIKGLNDNEIHDFVEMTKSLPIAVRFIEFMPFTGNKWDKGKIVPSAELLERIMIRHPNAFRGPSELNETARTWLIPGYSGNFGFISSMSDHFCATCNRLRLTADGQIKVCLFDAKEVSLRDKMRQGVPDDELLDIVRNALYGKKEKHAGMEDIDVITNRPMILIGAPNSKCLSLNKRLYNHRPREVLRHYSDGPKSLTHLDDSGRASMVNISDKQPSKRTATAVGRIYIPASAYNLVTCSYRELESAFEQSFTSEDQAKRKVLRKGDALTVAQLAGIMGCKRTSDLIPLCHPLSISNVDVTLVPTRATAQSETTRTGEDSDNNTEYSILCTATVACEGKTGVEMEALTAVTVSLLTVWDMLKAVAGREMRIGDIMVIKKTGGKSGDFRREL